METVMSSAGGSWSVPEGWGQGKGVFGGLLAGALVKAAQQKVTDQARQLRSLAMLFIAPPDVGPAELQVTVLREGGGSTTLEAALVQGTVRTKGLLVFSKARATTGPFHLPAPTFDRDWQKAETVPVGPPIAPVFAEHFEYRPLSGVPGSGLEVAEATGWVRPKQFSGGYDAVIVTACADAYWHSLQARGDVLRAALTVSFSVELYGDPGAVPANAPLFHHGVTWAMETGYASERRTLWSPDGQLLAVNHQSIAVLS